MRLSNLLAVATFLAASIAQAQSSWGFKGDCRSTAPAAAVVTFDLDFNMGDQAVVPVVEVDGYGNEIVTNVIVSFPLSSVLVVRLTTDVEAPLNGEASAYGVTAGSQLRALFPLRLGNQVRCVGTVERRFDDEVPQ